MDETSAHGTLSRDDILANWLEHTTAQLVFDDQYNSRPMDRADSMLEVWCLDKTNRVLQSFDNNCLYIRTNTPLVFKYPVMTGVHSELEMFIADINFSA